MERAVILTRSAAVDVDAITIASESHSGPAAPIEEPITLAETERRAIVCALNAANGRISGVGGTAERLGLKPTTLHAKMKKLGIQRSGVIGAGAKVATLL